MKRLIIGKMEAWDESVDRKPLILMGARQVGKTWLMEEFARRRYVGNTVVVNFMKSERLRLRFETTDLDPKSIIEAISIETGQKIVPGKTLLVLDEIQESPRALTALKFFNEDMPDLAVMAAGSLLGLSYGKNDDDDALVRSGAGSSFPVGKIDRLDVHPMTFAEFLRANGKESLVEAVLVEDWQTVGLLSREYESLLKNYLVVGGMPEAVADWVETGSLAEARKTQRRILSDYDDDFKKHAPQELLPKIRLLWSNIPAQLAKENKKFIYSSLRHGARAREYEVALEWLKDAGMVHMLYRVCPPRLPIAHYRDFGAFKLFMHDVGLLGAMSSLNPEVVLDGNTLFISSAAQELFGLLLWR